MGDGRTENRKKGNSGNTGNGVTGVVGGQHSDSGAFGNLKTQATGRISAVNAKELAQILDVVTGTFKINSVLVKVLFDTGATCSFVSRSNVEQLNLKNLESVSYVVVVPSGESYTCNTLYRNIIVRIGKVIFTSDL